MWKELGAKEKKKYDKKRESYVTKYEKQMAELDDKGYFTMDDGSKSTDHKLKVRKKKVVNAGKKA